MRGNHGDWKCEKIAESPGAMFVGENRRDSHLCTREWILSVSKRCGARQRRQSRVFPMRTIRRTRFSVYFTSSCHRSRDLVVTALCLTPFLFFLGYSQRFLSRGAASGKIAGEQGGDGEEEKGGGEGDWVGGGDAVKGAG